METETNAEIGKHKAPCSDDVASSEKELLSGAEIVAESLLAHGVDCVFGYPGGAVLPLYDALYSYQDRLQHVLVRHEQGAVHMAEGYARSTGKVGVALATSGPGASNLLTGLLDAHLDSVPLVVLAGQVTSDVIGKDAFQECDMIGMTGTITKHNFQVLDIHTLEKVLAQAFYLARTGRPGPVYVEVPKDIQVSRTAFKGHCQSQDGLDLPFYVASRPVDEEKVEEAAKVLVNAQRPVLLVGQGAVHADASQAITNFAKKLNIPVATTIMAKGIVDEHHPLSLGTTGMYGRKVANRGVCNADVLLALGCRFSDRVTGDTKIFAQGKKIIHVDVDPYEIGKNVPVYVGLNCDVKEAVSALQEKLEDFTPEWGEWTDELSARAKICDRCVVGEKSEYLHPEQVSRAVEKRLGVDDIITTGVGQHQMAATHFIKRSKPRTFITSGGAGTMGFGLPAGIGAALAKPDSTVWVMDGDGSLQMTGQELGTLAASKCRVIIIVFDNGYLGMVRQLQQHFCDSRYHGVSLPGSPDFVKLADAYGIKGHLATDKASLEAALDRATTESGSTLIHVALDPNSNVTPMFSIGGNISQCLGDCSKSPEDASTDESGGNQ